MTVSGSLFQLQNMLKVKTGWVSASGPDHEVILSSRARLARNLRRSPFPSAATPRAASAVLHSVFEACRKTPELRSAAYLRLEELEPVERLFLVERRLISRGLAAEPKHRGAVVGDREVLSLMVNEEDHLRLQAVDSGLCLRDLWTRLDALDDQLGQSLEYAADPRWGYLTACPTNTGTGMRVSALAHLPGLTLTGQIGPGLQSLSRVGMAARGMYGEGTKVIGDFYQISNATAMGRREADVVEDVARGVASLVKREMDSRRALCEGRQRVQVEDLVHRALGILSHARVVSFEEAMQHLSYLRMALTLGWKLPATLKSLNELLILAQPAHIQMLAQKELEPSDRDFLRAALFRRRLSEKPE